MTNQFDFSILRLQAIIIIFKILLSHKLNITIAYNEQCMGA